MNSDVVGNLRPLEELRPFADWANTQEAAQRTGWDPVMFSMQSTMDKLYPIVNASRTLSMEGLDLPEDRKMGACRDAFNRHIMDNPLARTPEYQAAHPVSRTVNSQMNRRDSLGTLACMPSCLEPSQRPILPAAGDLGMAADAYRTRAYSYSQEISAVNSAVDNGVTSADINKEPTAAAIARLVAVRSFEASTPPLPYAAFDSDARASPESEALYVLKKLHGVSSFSDKGLYAASLLVPSIHDFYFDKITKLHRRLLGTTAIKTAITSATVQDKTTGEDIYMSLESIGLDANSHRHVLFSRLRHLGMQLLCAHDHVAQEMLLRIMEDCDEMAPCL